MYCIKLYSGIIKLFFISPTCGLDMDFSPRLTKKLETAIKQFYVFDEEICDFDASVAKNSFDLV